MKLRNIFATLLVLAIAASTAKADEGMWLLNLIGKNYKQMKAQGFRLKPEDVYSVNKSSLKDAIVVFGGYCTGEIVSDKGLVFTNPTRASKNTARSPTTTSRTDFGRSLTTRKSPRRTST